MIDPRPQRRPRIGLGLILLTVVLLAALGGVVWAFTVVWGDSGSVHMSANGWIAMILAFVVTGALGGGLMWLAFYSSRKGYDDNVGGQDEDTKD
jgi:high-affinity Fe2+/Pb2+ permease